MLSTYLSKNHIGIMHIELIKDADKKILSSQYSTLPIPASESSLRPTSKLFRLLVINGGLHFAPKMAANLSFQVSQALIRIPQFYVCTAESHLDCWG